MSEKEGEWREEKKKEKKIKVKEEERREKEGREGDSICFLSGVQLEVEQTTKEEEEEEKEEVLARPENLFHTHVQASSGKEMTPTSSSLFLFSSFIHNSIK